MPPVSTTVWSLSKRIGSNGQTIEEALLRYCARDTLGDG